MHSPISQMLQRNIDDDVPRTSLEERSFASIRTLCRYVNQAYMGKFWAEIATIWPFCSALVPDYWLANVRPKRVFSKSIAVRGGFPVKVFTPRGDRRGWRAVLRVAG